MAKPFYITTPLYYVNAKPHIGHAYTNILCDTFARYRRFRGEKVFFLTGTDEHGTKIEKAAREQGKEPKAYVDEMVPQFQELWKLLGIQYDHFIRTTDAEHKKAVQDILKDLEARGEIYKKNYQGWYCTPCESFWTDLQLAERKCPDCHREVQELSEENYFFKLSKYQDWLVGFIKDKKNSKFIQPEIRRNEILGFLREPLQDLCITRPRIRLAWGIDYPTAKDYVVYVWFDALINYVSISKYPAVKEKFGEVWPADLHVVGKDILRQHAVYWPIMLKACGLEMPKAIIAHGWWTMGGQKVSKSRGNVVDPVELVKKYGTDAFRYYLLHEVTVGYDGTFSEDLLRERYTTGLANGLGNLWRRIATMLEKYCGGRIPHSEALQSDQANSHFRLPLFGMWREYKKALGVEKWNDELYEELTEFDPRLALNSIWGVITIADQTIEDKKPWILYKECDNPEKRSELERTLVELAEWMAHIAVLLLPFLPTTAETILKRLKVDDTRWSLPEMEDPEQEAINFAKPLLKAGDVVERGEILFPPLEEES
jgi:methionyl-tRNA synthetase